MGLERAKRLACDAGLELVEGAGGLELTDGVMSMRADFAALAPRLRPNRLSGELLVRAARVRGVAMPRAVDATAGLGEDAALLAAWGFAVTMFESDPVIAALLAEALARAVALHELAPVMARMELVEGDSVARLPPVTPAPDVVYLDPMFPERTKSAAVKKKFQLLHRLERPCADEAALLGAAMASGARKVVIKRPVKGPWLAGAKPAYTRAGKAIRYDVLLP